MLRRKRFDDIQYGTIYTTHFGKHCPAGVYGFRIGIHVDWLIDSIWRNLWEQALWPLLLDHLPVVRLHLASEPSPQFGTRTGILTLHLYHHQSCVFLQKNKKPGEHLEDHMPKIFYIFISSQTVFDRNNWVDEFKLLNWKAGQWATTGRTWLCIATDQAESCRNSQCINMANPQPLLFSVWSYNKNRGKEKRGTASDKYLMFSQK